MKKFSKIIFPAIIAAALMIGVPYIKNSSVCGIDLPLIFTGSVFGCGGDAGQTTVNETVKSEQVNSQGDKNAVNVKKGVPVVTFVELGSVNCIPCRMMQPVLEKIEKDYPGQVKVVFHDVWTPVGRTDGAKYGIRVIPTQVFLDSTGKEYFRHEGFFPFEEVDKILKQKGVK